MTRKKLCPPNESHDLFQDDRHSDGRESDDDQNDE